MVTPKIGSQVQAHIRRERHADGETMIGYLTSHNPFDSDDDASPSSKPFYRNPFDEHNDGMNGKGTGIGVLKHEEVHENPFDDEDTVPRNPFDGHSVNSNRVALFKEDRASGSNSSPDLQTKSSSVRSSHQFRERMPASDAVLKKAQRIKDVSATQASRLLAGVKEGSQNVFKGKDNGEAKSAQKTGVGRSVYGVSDGRGEGNTYHVTGRDELLGYDINGEAKARKTRYDDNQFQTQDLEYKSLQELQGYAVQKSEETTEGLQSCVKLAENIQEDATKVLLALHAQEQQIRKTHETALDIDQNLTRGEKFLGDLGGMFSRKWKPKKSRPVMGPSIARNDSFKRRGAHLEQRVALGLTKSNSKGHNNCIINSNVPQSTEEKLEMDRIKQDESLSYLSNTLDNLKIMSLDIGHELSSQDLQLGELQDDVGILNGRIKGANVRGRQLRGKG